MKLLQIGRLSNEVNAQLQQKYDTTQLWEQDDPNQFLQEKGAEFQLLVTSALYGCTAAQINLLPHLQAVCSFGVGYDSIDSILLHQKNIVLSNTPDVLTDCVADLALGLIIDVSRQISFGDRYCRSELWGSKQRFGMGHRISGKRLGILGFGRIGQAIAKRAQGFDMQIAYHQRHVNQNSVFRYFNDLNELANWADFLVIACPGGSATQHLVDAQVLAALGSQAYLINIARGSVVDEVALVTALQTGVIAGAGLDVFKHEPNIPNELLAMNHVVLTPHIGSATEETRQDMDQLLLSNVHAFVHSGTLITPV